AGQPVAPQPAPQPVLRHRRDDPGAEQGDDDEGAEQDRLVKREGFPGQPAEDCLGDVLVEHGRWLSKDQALASARASGAGCGVKADMLRLAASPGLVTPGAAFELVGLVTLGPEPFSPGDFVSAPSGFWPWSGAESRPGGIMPPALSSCFIMSLMHGLPGSTQRSRIRLNRFWSTAAKRIGGTFSLGFTSCM